MPSPTPRPSSGRPPGVSARGACRGRRGANPQEGGEAEGGVLPELTDLVGDGSFEKDGSGWDTVVTGGTRLGDALRSLWGRMQGHAKSTPPPTTTRACLWSQPPQGQCAVGRQLQSALTKEVELVKHGELVADSAAELVELHQHDRRRESHRAVFQSSASVWLGHGVVHANVQDEQHPAGCACCIVHGDRGAGGAPSANDRPGAPEGRSG
jgi:hypothetical protein